MKHFRLLLTALLVVSLASMTVYAGSGGAAGGAKKAMSIVGEDQPLKRADHQKVVSSYETFSGRFYPLAPDAAPLSGTYRIGSGKDYATISAALLSLAINGTSGPVTFYLTDASYTDAGLLIGAPVGVDSANPLLFQPDSNTSGVTVTLTNNASNGGGWVFSGSSYITINGTKKNGTAGDRDLTIQFDPAQSLPTGGLNGVIRVRDGCSNITVENCNIYGMYNGTFTDSRPGLSMTAGAVPNTDIVFDNNLVTRASIGIVTVGGDEFDTGLEITNNDIGGNFGTSFSGGFGQENYVQRIGIYSEWNDGANISGNEIRGVVTNIAPSGAVSGTADGRRTAGIHSQWGINMLLAENFIDSVNTTVPGGGSGSTNRRTYGIRANTLGGGFPSLNVIRNNSISRIRGKGAISGGDIGIEIFPGNADSILHNSISAAGTGESGRAAVGMQLSEDGSVAADLVVLNNAMSMTRTGTGSAAVAPYRVFNNSGDHDLAVANGNVLYSATYGVSALSGPGNDILAWQVAEGVDSASSQNDPEFTSDSDLHLSAGSAAYNLGVPLLAVATDIDGEARSATTPDAGFDETAGASTLEDVGPTALLVPSATGIPQGIAVTSSSVRYYNYSNLTSSYTAKLIVSDPGGSPLGTFTSAVSGHAPFTFKDVTFAVSFTPTALGAYEFRMISTSGADPVLGNDSVSAFVSAVPLVNGVAYSTGFEDSASNFGWTPEDQWINGDAVRYYDQDQSLLNAGGAPYLGVKVGGHITGPHSGSKAWHIYSTMWDSGHGYDDSRVSTLYSPFFNFTGYAVRPYLSLYINGATEPEFDVLNMSYSLDTGKTWFQLGVLDDPDGINWYSTTTYENAGHPNDDLDSAGAVANGMVTNITAAWTSNGDPTGSRLSGGDYATGPFGWIYNELRLPTAFIGKNYVRFRLQFWGDGNSYDDGFAVDDFAIAATGASSTASIAGKVYNDLDGNGTFGGGDTPISGAKVMMTGSKIDSAVTNGSGDYSFTGLAPGLFTIVQKTPPVGSATTVPANAAGDYTISLAPAEVVAGKDFGNFVGALSGKKYDDINHNGADNSEPGIAGFTIEIHRDSCAGTLYKSVVTDGSGNWVATVPPGTWGVREVQQPAYLRTQPAGANCYTFTTSVGTPSHSGILFGNFKYGKIEVRLNIDLNGNGIKEGGDFLTLPSPFSERFEFKKLPSGTVVKDTLGFTTVDLVTHATLDTGTYTVTSVTSPPAGYYRTTGATVQTFVISASGFVDTALYMDFKLMSISGKKFEDNNGDGIMNGADAVLSGWKINLTGPVVDSAVTDTAGEYSFVDLPGNGTYTVSEVVQAGWVKTTPAGNHSVLAVSGSDNSGKDFGNFRTVTISGKKYRDQNNNANLDLGEVGLENWQINGTGGLGSTLSDVNGDWSFTGVGPGSFTITETAQLGYTLTEPAGGNYVVVTASGVDVSGLDFGNFNVGDSNQYRSWTVAELQNALEAKPKKRPKAGKPILYPPNSGNLLEDMLKFQGGIIRIGLPLQMNLGNKEKGYLQPAKQADVFATFNKKGTLHTGPNRGIDMDIKGKLLLKRFKKLEPTKKNDKLIAELLALKINVLASALGKTPAGFGGLEINRPGSPWNGMTIDEFLAEMDTLMTNWEGEPYFLYDSAWSLSSAINGAFSTGSTSDTTATGGWTSAKLQWVAPIYLIDRPLLKHSSTVKAKAPVTESPKPLPTVYALNQNYPNPFNPTTTISFDLPEDALITLKLYNIVGQEVATLYNREEIGAGEEEVEFDASALPSGVYIYRLVAEGLNEDGLTTGNAFTQVKKMMLVK